MPCHIPSWIAGSFMLTGNLLVALYAFAAGSRDTLDWDAYKRLDPAYLDTEWSYRIKRRALFLSGGFINGIAWLFFAFTVIELSWLLSFKGRKNLTLSVSAMVFAAAGAMVVWFSFIFFFGATAAEELLYTKFNWKDWVRNDIDDEDAEGLGIRVMELTHVNLGGFVKFVAGVGWGFLGIILMCTFLNVRDWRKEEVTAFSARWNAFTLFIAIVCFLDFIAEIALFNRVRFAAGLYVLYSVIIRVFLVPAWVISLGIILPTAHMKTLSDEVEPMTTELQLTETQYGGTTPTNGGSQFTIGDDDDVPLSPPAEAFPPAAEES